MNNLAMFLVIIGAIMVVVGIWVLPSSGEKEAPSVTELYVDDVRLYEVRNGNKEMIANWITEFAQEPFEFSPGKDVTYLLEFECVKRSK